MSNKLRLLKKKIENKTIKEEFDETHTQLFDCCWKPLSADNESFSSLTFPEQLNVLALIDGEYGNSGVNPNEVDQQKINMSKKFISEIFGRYAPSEFFKVKAESLKEILELETLHAQERYKDVLNLYFKPFSSFSELLANGIFIYELHHCLSLINDKKLNCKFSIQNETLLYNFDISYDDCAKNLTLTCSNGNKVRVQNKKFKMNFEQFPETFSTLFLEIAKDLVADLPSLTMFICKLPKT